MNRILYGLQGAALAFLLAMASFSRYQPTNHQSPLEDPPSDHSRQAPSSYVPGTVLLAENGVRYIWDGTTLWTRASNGALIHDFGRSTFLAGDPEGNALIQIGNEQHKVRKVSLDGGTLWELTLPGLYPQGVILVGSEFVVADSTGVYGLSPQGTQLWERRFVEEGPAQWVGEQWQFLLVGPDARIYGAHQLGRLVVFSAKGDLVWMAPSSLAVTGAPAFGPKGEVYQPGGSVLLAFDHEGHLRWEFKAPGASKGNSRTTAAVGRNGDVYLAARTLFCISPEGKERWRFHPDTAEESFTSPPAIGPDGTLYLGSTGLVSGRVYAVTAEGRKRWVSLLSANGHRATPFRFDAEGWVWREETDGVRMFRVK